MKPPWKRPHLWVAFLYLAIVVGCDPLSLAPLAVLFCGLSGAVFFISSRHPKDFHFLFGIFAGGLLLRVFLILLFYQLSYMPFSQHPQFLLLNDSYPYSENGWHLLQFWREKIPFDLSVFVQKGHALGSLSGGISPYDYWNAAVYSVVGKQPMVMFCINAVIGVLPVLLLYDMAQQLVSLRAARMTALLSAFWPSLFLWSTQNLRDPILIYLTAQFIWALMWYRDKPSFAYLALTGLSAWALFFFSKHVFILLCVMSLPLSLFFGSEIWKRSAPDTKIVIAALSFVVLLVTIPFLIQLVVKRWLLLYDFKLLNFIAYMRKSRSFRTGSAFLEDFDLTSVPMFIAYVPLGLLYAFFAPFPWQLGSAQQAFGAVEMIFFYTLCPFLFRGTSYLLKTHFKEAGILAFFIPFTMVTLCLMEGNVGTLFRHRSFVTPFLLLAIGIGWARREKRRMVSE